MIAKQIHNLFNTNQQNHKYYGKSTFCPSCSSEVETLPHVLSHQSSGASKSRALALSVLQADLTTIGTPPSAIAAITHGTLEWECTQRQQEYFVHAITRGSLQGPDMLLTRAFTDQFHTIGWTHFLMGKLSHKWGAAVALYMKKPHDWKFQSTWTAQTIHCLWKYTQSI
jgi:hypothetical protein